MQGCRLHHAVRTKVCEYCRDNGTLDSYVGLLVAEDGKHLVEKFLLFESYCSKLLFKDLVVGKF